MDRTNQLHLRHYDIPIPVVCVQMSISRNAKSFSIRLVYWRVTFTNLDCSHDSDSENPFHSKPGILAGHVHDLCNHGYRHNHTLLALRNVNRISPTSLELFSMVDRNIALLLHAHPINQKLVYQTLWHMALMYENDNPHNNNRGDHECTLPRGPTHGRNWIHRWTTNQWIQLQLD